MFRFSEVVKLSVHGYQEAASSRRAPYHMKTTQEKPLGTPHIDYKNGVLTPKYKIGGLTELASGNADVVD